MVHLRIVAPSHNAEHALDLLRATPSVCNLIYLPGAAQKPEGDVILCDVAREDASVVISDLREFGIDREGSIAIEDIDSLISDAADAGRAGGRGAAGGRRRLGGGRGPDLGEHRALGELPHLHGARLPDRRGRRSCSTRRS